MPARVCVRSSHCFLADQSNPAGLVAGSRGSFRGSRGNDPRTRGLEVLASWRDARTARLHVKPAPIRVRLKDRLATALAPILGAGGLAAFTRWSAPFPLADHRLPAANPAGLVSESEIGTQPRRMNLKSLMQPCRRSWRSNRHPRLKSQSSASHPRDGRKDTARVLALQHLL